MPCAVVRSAAVISTTDERENMKEKYVLVPSRVLEKLDAINKRLDAMVLAQRAANDAFSDIIAETGGKSPFKLDDTKMQDGIASIMGYDPADRKRGDE